MSWHTTSRQSRGYGRAWEITRERILRRDGYLCQCRHCKAEKRTTPASEVDHIVPRSRGGSDEDSNLQAIGKACHARKTIEDAGSTYRPRQRIGLDGWPA